MEIYLIAQSGVIAALHTIHTSIARLYHSQICDLHLYAWSALKTKLNQKHCLKFMWSIDYGLAIVNERIEEELCGK